MSAPKKSFRTSAPKGGKSHGAGRPGAPGKSPRAGKPRHERFDGGHRGTSQPQRAERLERSGRGERPESSHPERAGRPERSERTERTERPARPARSDRTERTARADFPERSARDARYVDNNRPARTERGERGERPTGSGSRDRFERDGSERPQSGDRRSGAGRPSRNSAERGGLNRAPARSSGRRSEKSYDSPAQPLPERFRGTVVNAEETLATSFDELGVAKRMVEALAEMGASAPFAIQAATIPAGLSGRDLLVRSHTGSGKTIAFGVSLVDRVVRSERSGARREYGRAPKGLIVAPTRELALQIDRVVQPLAQAVGLFTTQVYGGVPQGKQVGALRRGVDIVIGTPGRLEDLIAQGHLDLSGVIVSTIDEADHMAELGFIEPVRRLLSQTAHDGQRLLFSATLDRQVASLVEQFLDNPAIFELADVREDHSSVDHEVYVIDPRDKDAIVTDLVKRGGKTLVFTRTRRAAEGFRDTLREHGIRAVDLHGDLNQNRRQRNLAELTSGRVNVLVATDVAARGIHVDDVDLVIQADAPEESKAYVHRAGRTGRAGKSGQVITLTTSRGQQRLGAIMREAGVEWVTSNVRPQR